MLYNGQAHLEYFAAFAAKFQNAPEHFTTLHERVKYKLKSLNYND